MVFFSNNKKFLTLIVIKSVFILFLNCNAFREIQNGLYIWLKENKTKFYQHCKIYGL